MEDEVFLEEDMEGVSDVEGIKRRHGVGETDRKQKYKVQRKGTTVCGLHLCKNAS
jgi:hypothetical protein